MKSTSEVRRGSFSLVIPFLQRHELLKRTISSIAGQSNIDFAKVELILVDDGGDGRFSWEQSSLPFSVKYIYLPRMADSGAARARNHGISLARNEIVVFLDSDTILPARFLDRLATYFKTGEPTAVVGTRVMLSEDFSKALVPEMEPLRENPDYFEFRHKVLARYSFNMRCIKHPWLLGYSCNLAVDRRSVLKVGGFDERFLGWGMEDVEFSYRLYQNNVRFYLAHDTEVFHQHHEPQAKIDPTGVQRNTERNFGFFVGSHPELIRKIPAEDLLGMFQARVSIHRALNNLSGRRTREFQLDDSTTVVQVVGWILLCVISGRRIVMKDYSKEARWSLFVQRLPFVRVYYYPVISRPYLLKCRFEYSC